MSNNSFIPFHLPSIGAEEIQEVVATLRSGWLTTGPRTRQFEQEFAAYTGAPHALALNSGTAALHIALAALGIGPGDEVITTPLTFCSTVSTILHVGATPVLADIGPDGNIDPASIERRITLRTAALLPVHYAGLSCDMDALWRIARRHHLHVIEDAAHAVGTRYHGQHVGCGGSGSDAVAFSFYATKNLTTAEGGMVTARDPALMERMRRLALHGINKDAWNRYAANGKWFYTVTEPGFKYNLTDVASAMGLHQLRKQEQFLKVRHQIAQQYQEAFGKIDELETPPEAPAGDRHAWHLYTLRLRLNRLTLNRDEFIEELTGRGVGASVHFIPIPLHAFFGRWAGRPEQHCPRALELYSRLISLPLYPGLTSEQINRVVSAVTSIVSAHRPLSMAVGAGI